MSLEVVRIAPMGESALLVVLGEIIDRELAARARAIAAAIEAAPGRSGSFGRPVTAYASVLVPFDPLSLSVAEATAAVAAIVDATVSGAGAVTDAGHVDGRLVEVFGAPHDPVPHPQFRTVFLGAFPFPSPLE